MIKIFEVHVEVLLSKVIFEMMLSLWRPPGRMQWWWLRRQAHVFKDFSNHFGIEKNLRQQGYNINEIPLVLQYNKRDLPNALPISEMRKHLNKYNSIEIEACAFQGQGVLETFKTVSKSIIQVLKGSSVQA